MSLSLMGPVLICGFCFTVLVIAEQIFVSVYWRKYILYNMPHTHIYVKYSAAPHVVWKSDSPDLKDYRLPANTNHQMLAPYNAVLK
jgi:hypothetical protein